MGCGCKAKAKAVAPVLDDHGQAVLAEYQGAFRLTLRGPASKRDYGTHKRGDQFEVLVADINHSPTLFKVI